MKVAVIGGGFYGIMASLEAAKTEHVNQVFLFEKDRSLFNAAGKYNQARLHLGFHYPRSPETIQQSKSGFSLYSERFPAVTKSINKNIYLIREDGRIGINEYLNVMRKNKLNFIPFKMSESAFKYKANNCAYQAIQVEEKYIDIVKLNKNLSAELDELGINVKLNHEVINIDTYKGKITFSEGKEEIFDLIINCTYTDPFNGFNNIQYPLKFEFCTLLLISSEEIKEQAITIMDGEFVSIYPWLSNLHSVSSVKYTPSIKSNNLFELKKLIEKRTFKESKKTSNLIEQDMKSFLDFNYTLVGDFSTIKVKLKNDEGDQRIVKTFSEGKCITVLQGKLDAVNIFLNDLARKLKGFK